MEGKLPVKLHYSGEIMLATPPCRSAALPVCFGELGSHE